MEIQIEKIGMPKEPLALASANFLLLRVIGRFLSDCIKEDLDPQDAWWDSKQKLLGIQEGPVISHDSQTD